MSWHKYGEARTLADSFEFSVACAKAGVPVLLVAPPSGGKTTVIFATEKFLGEHGEACQRVSRLGLRGLKALGDWLSASKVATLLNEDYATLGSATYMVEKMGELIGALSYSGTYQDQGLGLDLRMVRLGFISGIQPLWIKTMMTHPVFATHVREKFIRYYVLPYTPTRSVDMLTARDDLVKGADYGDMDIKARVPLEFVKALSVQVGSERAQEYAPRICRELSRLMPRAKVYKALRFYAVRLGFERDFVERELAQDGFKVETRWQGYHALYWVLRKGKVSRLEFMDLLGVTSMRSVERAVENALRYGWVTSMWNSGELTYVASEPIKKRVGLL